MASRSSNPHPNVEDRRDVGERAREKTPLPDQADWHVVDDRPDPVELLLDQDKAREPDLVPVRHGRMLVSPFTFYRGSADHHGHRPGRHAYGGPRRPTLR